MRKHGVAGSLPKRASLDLAQQKLQKALALQQAGQRAQAKSLYEEILRSHPEHFDALQLLALIVSELNRFDEAESLYLKALRIRPNSAGVHVNYGTMLHRLKRFEAAVASYDRALALDPKLAVAYTNRGVALGQLGRFEESVASHNQAIIVAPDHADGHFNRGNTFKELKLFPEALTSYERALAINSNFVDAYMQRGNVLKEIERFDDALRDFDRVIELRKNHAEAYSSRGLALHSLNRLEEALESFNIALTLSPDNAQTLSYRGIVLHGLKDLEAALADLRKSVSLRPEYAAAYSNLGVVLKDLRRFDEAIEAFFNAVTLDKNKPSVYWNLATLLLMIGNFRDGWEFYEWRKKIDKPFGSRKFDRPLWLGKESLKDKTILIHAEQGIGDVIQFCRYVKLIEAQASKVIFAVPDKLIPIIRSLSENITVCSDEQIEVSFDLHCPLISLPFIFGTDLDTVPAQIPYLHADHQQSRSLRERLSNNGEKKIVGLSWFSKSEKTGTSRSIRLLDLLTSIDHTGYAFVNLQYGDMLEEIADLKQKTGIEVVSVPEIDNYDDIYGFAALVDACDIVLSIDNTTIHIAGALGKDTLVMLPCIPDWRWMLDRTDTPWYPTLRLFRQEVQDDWLAVFRQIQCVLTGTA